VRHALPVLGVLAFFQTEALTVSQVKTDYGLLFPCTTVITDSTVAHHRLGPFVREVWYFQAYLRYGRPGGFVGSSCQEKLRTDSVFNATMLPAMRAYLRKQGSDLVGVPDYQKRVITWDEVLAVASRFFYADQLREDGSVARYICGAKNGIAGLPGRRDYVLEAFAYAGIFRELKSDTPRLLPRDRAVLTEITQRSDLPADSAARILTIRQVYFEEIAREPVLRDVLRDYYEQKADYLPFVFER
jgi:hypothetical protein